MRSKFLTKENLDFDRKEQSIKFKNGVEDEIAERLAKYVEEENYTLRGKEYAYRHGWSLEYKTKILQSQIAMFLPTLNNILEEYFSIRNISLGTSLNTLNFMFCFTIKYHYKFPFAINFIQLLDNNDERIGFTEKHANAENRIIEQELERFQKLYNVFNLESITKGRLHSPTFWIELLRIYITDVIQAVKSHDVFKILGNITNTEVALGQNDTETVEKFFTSSFRFPKGDRFPGNFSDSYMAVSSRNHLLSPNNPEHIDEINRIIETYGISEETLDKFNFYHETTSTPSTMSLSDDDMDSTIDPEDQKEISAESDALTPCHSSNHVTKLSSSREKRTEKVGLCH